MPWESWLAGGLEDMFWDTRQAILSIGMRRKVDDGGKEFPKVEGESSCLACGQLRCISVTASRVVGLHYKDIDCTVALICGTVSNLPLALLAQLAGLVSRASIIVCF